MKKIKCVILEDEKPAQGVLKKYIDEIPNLELAGVYTNPLSAIDDLQSDTIDLVFLDINLPKISGLNFLKSLRKPPNVIITTAYPEYAMEGYELNVIDYLLKPISFERFLNAVSKLDSRLPASEAGKQESVALERDHDNFTFEKADNTIYKIVYSQIRYIESDRDYVNIFTEEKKHVFRQSLKYWERLLPDDYFVRVHKSYIVNISMIDTISGNRIIAGDDVIPVGRNYKDGFLEKINSIR